ncbi:MAG: OFA family MFS transporter [Chthonomonadetes bacterium]|nr:OFA family MFS transporter [Chthonomonadetes bacterium]
MKSKPAASVQGKAWRWLLVGIGILINLCCGTVYAFSVFRKPIEELWGISATASGFPFMVFLASFAGTMPIAGALLDRWGPRRTALIGGMLVGGGWILAGLSPNIAALTLTYGLIAGGGVGFVYGCPILVAARWFPDKRGLAVGLTLIGFGLSPLITAPVVNALITALGPSLTFIYVGVAFLGILTVLSLPLRLPPPEWYNSASTNHVGQRQQSADLTPREMLKTGAFYALWTTFAIGCLVGLMAIGITAPFGTEVVGLSAGLAAASVSLFAVFNGVGRPLFGWLADRITPRYAAGVSYGLILLAAGMLVLWGQGNLALYFVGFSVLWLNLGAWLAIAPAATATLFGVTHYGRNYGIVYTAYGAGAILGMILSGILRDSTGTYLSVFPPVMLLAGVGILIALWGLRPVHPAQR